MEADICNRCQVCGVAMEDDFVARFWHSTRKEFRAFMGRCGKCFDSARYTWDRRDEREEREKVLI